MTDWREQVEPYVRHVIPQLADSPLVTTRLAGQAGLRHHVYKVQASRLGSVVVRINAISSESERAKSRRECAVLRFLNGRHAPDLLDCDESGQIFSEPTLCLAFVEGEVGHSGVLPTSSLCSFGRGLSDLHQTEMTTEVFEFLGTGGYSTSAEHITDVLHTTSLSVHALASRHPSEALARDCLDLVEKIEVEIPRKLRTQAFQTEDDLCLLHGDVVDANIVWQDEKNFTLIDWEDVRLGDPGEEIAYFFSENRLGDDARAAFWDGYTATYRSDSESLRQRTAAWYPLVALASVNWWLERYCEPVPEESLPPEFFKSGAEKRLEWSLSHPMG